jgi:hypothetical protein
MSFQTKPAPGIHRSRADEFRRPRRSLQQMSVPHLAAVDELARLQLGLRRVGLEIRLCYAPDELLELVELAGLSEVLGVEPGRQAEEREDVVGVEEERELDDPLA